MPFRTPHTDLYDSVKINDLFTVREILCDNPKIIDRKALLLAVKLEFPEMVDLLLDMGANPDESFLGTTIFDFVARFGNMDIFMILMRSKSTFPKWLKLYPFLRYDRFDMVKILIEKGVQIRESDIVKASRHSSVPMVKLLLENGANVNAKGEEFFYPLHESIGNSYDMVKLLLENGANVNLRDRAKGNTPIFLASTKGNIDIIELLLSYGSNVNDWNKNGETPIMRLYSNSVKTLDYLISKGVNLNMADNKGNTFFHRFIESVIEASNQRPGSISRNFAEKLLKIYNILIEAEADINIPNHRGVVVNKLLYSTLCRIHDIINVSR